MNDHPCAPPPRRYQGVGAMTSLDYPLTADEMANLDVDLDLDLDRVWSGVAAGIWASPTGPVERSAGVLLRSPGLARALVTTPSLVLSWMLASALVFAIGAVVTLQTGTPIIPLFAPVLAAVGVSFSYGAGTDPAYELTRTMAISNRMILLVRVLAVFATNALLGAVASLFTPALAGVTFLWLLPMVAIALLGLALATLLRSASIGSVSSMTVWSAIVLGAEIRDKSAALVVARSTLVDAAPLYLMLAAISLAVIIWSSGDWSKQREFLRWS